MCNDSSDSSVIFDTHLINDIDTLTNNSVLLTSLAEEISQTFKAFHPQTRISKPD